MDPLLRQAARLIIVDPEYSVLLFQYEDDQRRWWATPGGGLEGGETFEEAAAREAEEELSLTGGILTPLWSRTVEFTFRGQPIRQVERYFLMRISRVDLAVAEAVREAHRREGIVAARWWSLAEHETKSEQVFPEDLSECLRGLRKLHTLP
jgi:8-oxo-dGTP pyrophosphatase MutT (NUDIX family)